MPEVEMTDTFRRLMARLPEQVREQTRRKLRLLAENPAHPSLRVKRMADTGGIWEMSVTMAYRVSFVYEGNRILLRKVGPHDILQNP